MKRLIFHLLIISVLLLSYACSKPDNPSIEPETGEFSFTYNGEDYHYSSLYQDNVGVSYNDLVYPGILAINIFRPEVFGGVIHFDTHNCAYLAPEFNDISIGENCALTNRQNGQIIPIDPLKVYTYVAGSLDLSLSDCKTHTTDLGISTYTYKTCIASGTFNLTLGNQNNETIIITNGIINNFLVFY